MAAMVVPVALSVAVAGCAPRLCDDIFRLDEVDPMDRVVIEQDRSRVPTGGTTSLVQQPRFVYLAGALVDTNRERWYWIAGGPLAPPGGVPELPLPPAPPSSQKVSP
jgi:hypothetical protein